MMKLLSNFIFLITVGCAIAIGAPKPAKLSSVNVSPSSVIGGQAVQGTVTLAGRAPSGGASISLSSNNSAATVPASVLISRGATNGVFTVTTSSVISIQTVTITATYNTVVKTAILTINPSSPPPAGNVYYVKKTGSDSNSCTAAKNIATPKLTISSALACLAAGETVEIADASPQTYAEFITNGQIPNGPDSSHKTTLKATNRRTITIQPTSVQNPFRAIYFSDAGHIEVQGLIVDAVEAQLEAIKITVSSGSTLDIVINDCEVKNAQTMGILITGDNTSGCEIKSSLIHENGYDPGDLGLYHQVYVDSPGHSIHDNEMYAGADNTTGYGVHIYGNDTMSHQRVYNNTIHDVGVGIGVFGGDDQLFWNNVIYHCTLGMRARSYAAIGTVSFYNNTIDDIYVGPGGGGIGILGEITFSFTALNVRNNIVSNTGGNVFANGLGGTRDHQLVSNSPGYVNAGTHDYHLTAGSAAVNAGVDLSAFIPALDKDGVVRPQGIAWDIGAYER